MNQHAAFNQRMRAAFATLAIQLRRSSWRHRHWAREANASGKSQAYHEHAARAIRDWHDARDYIRQARNWS